jgi:hypothetical protein
MRKVLALCAAVLALPSLARAGDVEVTGFAGYTFPFYSQSFSYDPGPVAIPLPGVSVQQRGSFDLKASGGAAFGGAIAFYPTSTLGVELRVDRASVAVDTKTAGYDVNLTLPAPFDPVKTTLDLTKGTAKLSAATPVSLNLKLRSGERGAVYVSGGISHLGDLNFSLSQTLALGLTAVNLQTSNLEIATLGFVAKRKATETGGSWGGNVGLGLQIPFGDRGHLILEGRGFYFPKQTYDWTPFIDTPLPPLQQVLLDRLNIPALELKPWWAQATVGFSFRF